MSALVRGEHPCVLISRVFGVCTVPDTVARDNDEAREIAGKDGAIERGSDAWRYVMRVDIFAGRDRITDIEYKRNGGKCSEYDDTKIGETRGATEKVERRCRRTTSVRPNEGLAGLRKRYRCGEHR